ncbi:putative CENPB DNA-binding domain-containing protein 1 [Hippopotamus amphibius kiboko]|uniref:putative CENPB DNA-binding domain-containing protein 1 n=1 Tax=Hippopotamus amphibius kiboko TaxID=575201 RepID=UPI0025936571|nr:putative CENPB DNA-binding domain-containing protein 1 [Hippopotamus amphibius kiboko]
MMEIKVKIIGRVEQGEKLVDVTRSYKMNCSTISTILMNKDKIMEHSLHAVPRMLTIISKRCGKVMEETERLLSVWMHDQPQCWVPLSLMLIQEKATRFYEDLKKHSEESEGASFNISHGWLH